MATELKKKRKFKIVHVLWGIIAVGILIPVSLYAYAFVIDPAILARKAVRNTKGYFAALSEQDYERAADYIKIKGDREVWIERMEQLEQTGITIQGIQGVSAYKDDFQVRSVDFDVVIDANGTELVFDYRTIPLFYGVRKGYGSSGDSDLLHVSYDSRLSSSEFWDEVIERVYAAGGIDTESYNQYKAGEIDTYEIQARDDGIFNQYLNEVNQENGRLLKSRPEIDQAKFAISSELVRE